MPTRSIYGRFLSHVADVSDPSACWLWTGAKNEQGYGYFVLVPSWSTDADRAHRVSYFLFKGEIPAGLFVLHACDVPACVNPAHLFLGTQKDNMADCNNKGRGPDRSGVQNGRAKLDALSARLVRGLHAEGWTQLRIAACLEISPSQVRNIIRGRAWKGHECDAEFGSRIVRNMIRRWTKVLVWIDNAPRFDADE